MMKKGLILISALSLLMSCAQNLDIEGGDPTDPGKNPVGSKSELTISTMSNPTRAIIKDKKVPGDNFIGMLPRFFSETVESDYESYNQLMTFGYDAERSVWRGISGAPSPLTTKGLLDEVQDEVFMFNPFYWPGGDRVAMDYVAFSYYNLRENLLQALKYYGGLSLPTEIRAVVDLVMDAYPVIKNENRVDVWYQNMVLNLLSYALTMSFQSPVLDPYVVVTVLALSAVYEIPTGFEENGETPMVTLADVETVLPYLIEAIKKAAEKEKEPVIVNPAAEASALASGEEGEVAAADSTAAEPVIQEEIPAEIKAVLMKFEGAASFVKDYVKATRVIEEKDLTLADAGLTETAFRDAVNTAYYIFMKNLPLVSEKVQDDLLYSYGRSLRNSGGPIQAMFNHAKAWVKVLVNNQTDNDIFISSLAFDNVKTGGALVIDNSKSGFEVYWDFLSERPEKPEEEPEEPEDSEIGLTFEPYETTTLDGVPADKQRSYKDQAPASANPFATKAAAVSEHKASKNPLSDMNISEEAKEEIAKLFTMGLIADTYLAPAGCYGPAAKIELTGVAERAAGEAAMEKKRAAKKEGGVTGEPSTDSTAAEAAEIETEPSRLQLHCLSGSNPVDDKVVGLAANLGGAMFPAQEPGTITLTYYPVLRDKKAIAIRQGDSAFAPKEAITRDGYVVRDFEMGSTISYLYDNLRESDLQTVTLNLPRQNWKMGKAYIYVITITNNEITINGVLEKEWEEVVVTHPAETGLYSKDPTEEFEKGNTEGWF